MKKYIIRFGFCAIIIWVVYYGVIRFGSLPPTVFSGFSHKTLSELYQRDHRGNIHGVNVLFNRGDLMQMNQSYDRAAFWYLQGLERVKAESLNERNGAKLASVEFKAAHALIRLRRYDQAIQALTAHLKRLRTIRRHLHSNDPKVRQEFDSLIDTRSDLLAQLMHNPLLPP
jgi:hypothetical protein